MERLIEALRQNLEDILQLAAITFLISSILVVNSVLINEEVEETIFYSSSHIQAMEVLEAQEHFETTTTTEVIFEEETKPLTNEERICSMVDDICKEMEFDKPELIKSMIYCESSFNKNRISHAGARGLMQITPRWFGELMKEYNVTDLCEDEEGNIRIGIFWINRLINKYDGDIHKALVAYNCGESYVYKNKSTSSSYSRKVIRIAGEYIV